MNTAVFRIHGYYLNFDNISIIFVVDGTEEYITFIESLPRKNNEYIFPRAAIEYTKKVSTTIEGHEYIKMEHGFLGISAKYKINSNNCIIIHM